MDSRWGYDALKVAGILATVPLLFFNEAAQQLLAPAALLYAAAVSADLYSTSGFLKRGEKESHPVMAYFLRRLRTFKKATVAVLLTWEAPGVVLMTALFTFAGLPVYASLTVVFTALAAVHTAAAAHNWDLLG